MSGPLEATASASARKNSGSSRPVARGRDSNVLPPESSGIWAMDPFEDPANGWRQTDLERSVRVWW